MSWSSRDRKLKRDSLGDDGLEMDPLAPKDTDLPFIPYTMIHVRPEFIINNNDEFILPKTNDANQFPDKQIGERHIRGTFQGTCKRKSQSLQNSCKSDQDLCNKYDLKECKVLLNRINVHHDDKSEERNDSKGEVMSKSLVSRRSRKRSKMKKRVSWGRVEKRSCSPKPQMDADQSSYLKQCRVLLERISYPLKESNENCLQQSRRTSFIKSRSEDDVEESRPLLSKLSETSPRLRLRLVKERTLDQPSYLISNGVKKMSDRESVNIPKLRSSRIYSCEPCGESSLKVKITREHENNSYNIESTENDLEQRHTRSHSHKRCFPIIKSFKADVLKSRKKLKRKRASKLKKVASENYNGYPVPIKECYVLIPKISLPLEGGSDEYNDQSEECMAPVDTMLDSCASEKLFCSNAKTPNSVDSPAQASDTKESEVN